MQSFFLALFATLILVNLQSCAGKKSGNDGNGEALVMAQEDDRLPLTQQIIFSHDNRPSDGLLEEFTFTRNDVGNYDSTYRKAYADRVNGKDVDETETLTNNLICVAHVLDYVCSVDARPVDGALIEITMFLSSPNTYDIKLRRAYYDQVNGKEVEETKILAVQLALKNVWAK